MAQEPLATEGNVLFVSEFRVIPGRGEELMKLFKEFDYSDDNLMHREPAQVKDGVLCRDPLDPDHFFLIGEWKAWRRTGTPRRAAVRRCGLRSCR